MTLTERIKQIIQELKEINNEAFNGQVVSDKILAAHFYNTSRFHRERKPIENPYHPWKQPWEWFVFGLGIEQALSIPPDDYLVYN